MSRWWFAVRRWFGLGRADQDLDEELRAHLAMVEREFRERGASAEEAAFAARRDLGNVSLVRETTREMWGTGAVERFVQDIGYVGRQMRRNPMFAGTAIGILALGLGATTAMFSIVNGVLLQPLGFHDPGRLFLARTLPPAGANVTGEFPVNARQFHEWRTRCQSCESAALVRYDEFALTGAGTPAELPAFRVSFDFFRVLGVQPAFGRDFLREEELPGRADKVILTDALWRRRFAADPGILGRTLVLDGAPCEVIGVMPADLHLPKGEEWGQFFGPQNAPLLFKPLGIDVAQGRPVGQMNYMAVMRLKPGVARDTAITEMNALLAEFRKTDGLKTSVTLIPFAQQVVRQARSALWLLLGAVAAVLLTACVNVGNLMLVRTASRQREAGVRLALGASRSRLFAFVLKEALVLVAMGTALGLLLARVGWQWWMATAPASVPRLDEVRMDWRVLLVAVMAAGVSTLVCGLVPAWRLSRTEPLASIKTNSGGMTESGSGLRLRDALVGVEVALSTMLLIGGGLLLLSFVRVLRVDKGFDVAHVVTQELSFSGPHYRDNLRVRFLDQIVQRVKDLPGVDAAAAVNQLPLIGEDWVSDLRDPDGPQERVETAALANFRFVTPGYWQALGVALQQGRWLEAADRQRATALVSERAARQLWPGQNPLGKHVAGMKQGERLEVVGVVAEVRAAGLEQSTPTMMVYQEYGHMRPNGMSLVVRTHGDPAAMAGAIRTVVAEADPEMALPPAKTMAQVLDESVAGRRFQMYVAVAFALTALLLAGLGIYGVVSFAVARRTPELGIRMALGAGTARLIRQVVTRALWPVAGGIGVGLIGALGMGRLLASQLFGVSPHDPLTMTAVVLVLLGAALLACWLPARRATQIDPVRALRFEA